MRKLRIIGLSWICWAYGLSGVSDANTVLNLTNTTIDRIAATTVTVGATTYSAGVLGEVVFRRPVAMEPVGSGSGVYRRLFKIQQNVRIRLQTVTPSSTPQVTPGYNAVIRISDLRTSWTALITFSRWIPTSPAGGIARFLSMSDFRCAYIGGVNIPVLWPTTVGNLGAV